MDNLWLSAEFIYSWSGIVNVYNIMFVIVLLGSADDVVRQISITSSTHVS